MLKTKPNTKEINDLARNKKKTFSLINERTKNFIEQFILKFDRSYHNLYDLGKLVKIMNFLLENVDKFDIESDYDIFEQKCVEKLKIKRNYKILKTETVQSLPKIDTTHNPEVINTNYNLRNSHEKSFSKENLKTQTGIYNLLLDPDFIPLKKIADSLKHKETDEWAKLAKMEGQELFRELIKKRKEKDEEMKKVREVLDHQISAKKEKENMDKELDGYYFQVQSRNNEKYYKNVSEMKQQKKKAIEKVNENRDAMIKCSY